MNKYLKITGNNAERHLAYRFRMMVWIIVDILQFVMFPFIWLSIFSGRADIAGFTKEDIVTYYVVAAFVALAAHSHVSRITRMDIMEGGLNQWLTKPINYYLQNMFRELGYKVIAIFLILAVTALAYLALPNYIRLPQAVSTIFIFLLFLVPAYLIAHLIEFLIGIASFWIGETGALSNIKSIINTVFNGKLAPIHFFPPLVQLAAGILPFQYLGYIPAQIFLENISGPDIARHALIALLWVAALGTFAALAYRRGLRAYEGVGI